MNNSTDSDYNTAFTGCDNLTSIYIDNTKLKSIGNGYGIDNQVIVDTATRNTLIYGAQGIINLSNNEVLSVGKNAFANHIKLSSIDLPNV